MKVLPDAVGNVQSTRDSLEADRSGIFEGHNIHGNVHPMVLAAYQNSSGWAYIVVISSPCERDVTRRWAPVALVGSNSTQPIPGTKTVTHACEASAPARRGFPGGGEVTKYPLT